MKRFFVILILAISTLLALPNRDAQAGEPPPALDWYIHNLEQSTKDWEINEHSLQIDSNGNAHVAYIRLERLYHAWYDGTTWFAELVDDSNVSNPSLVLDSADIAQIIYFSGSNLKHARSTNNGWVIKTFDTGADNPVPVVLDATDRPHICTAINKADVTTGYVYAIKYAVWTGSDWDSQTLEQGSSEQIIGVSCSLALDSSGSPHISYAVSNLLPMDYIKYARRIEGAWDIQIVQQEQGWNVWGWAFYLKDIVLDTADVPQIFFDHNEAGHPPQLCLTQARQMGDDWEIHRILCQRAGMSLVLDREKNPHILSSRNYMVTDVTHVYWADNTWNYQTIDNSTDTAHLSLAFDTHNQAHAIYYDSNLNLLKYAQQLPSLSLTLEAIPKRNLTINEPLTYTLALSGPAGHNVLLWDPLPENVEYVPGSISSSAIYSPTIRTILWQGTLPTDTLPIISFQVTLTNTVGVTVTVPTIINTAWLTDTAYGNHIESLVIVNGRESYFPLIMGE